MAQPNRKMAVRPAPAPEVLETAEVDASPKPLTGAQTMMLTMKILVVAAVVLGLLWLLSRGS